MKTITEIHVSVELLHRNESLAHATVSIEIVPGQPIQVEQLLDACQRSVAHCIDELKKDIN